MGRSMRLGAIACCLMAVSCGRQEEHGQLDGASAPDRCGDYAQLEAELSARYGRAGRPLQATEGPVIRLFEDGASWAMMLPMTDDGACVVYSVDPQPPLSLLFPP